MQDWALAIRERGPTCPHTVTRIPDVILVDEEHVLVEHEVQQPLLHVPWPHIIAQK